MKRLTNQLESKIDEVHNHDIDVTSRQIFISHDDNGIDHSVATKLIKNLSLLESADSPILIHQLSCGGDAYCGMAMYDAIAHSRCSITILCHGQCMSMATVVLQAADVRVSMPNATFMLHEGGEHIDSNHKAAQSWLLANKAFKQNMLNLYAMKCKSGAFFKDKKYTANKIRQYIQSKFDRKEDWVLTAEEALNYGIIDKILKEPIYTLLSNAT